MKLALAKAELESTLLSSTRAFIIASTRDWASENSFTELNTCWWEQNRYNNKRLKGKYCIKIYIQQNKRKI